MGHEQDKSKQTIPWGEFWSDDPFTPHLLTLGALASHISSIQELATPVGSLGIDQLQLDTDIPANQSILDVTLEHTRVWRLTFHASDFLEVDGFDIGNRSVVIDRGFSVAGNSVSTAIGELKADEADGTLVIEPWALESSEAESFALKIVERLANPEGKSVELEAVEESKEIIPLRPTVVSPKAPLASNPPHSQVSYGISKVRTAAPSRRPSGAPIAIHQLAKLRLKPGSSRSEFETSLNRSVQQWEYLDRRLNYIRAMGMVAQHLGEPLRVDLENRQDGIHWLFKDRNLTPEMMSELIEGNAQPVYDKVVEGGINEVVCWYDKKLPMYLMVGFMVADNTAQIQLRIDEIGMEIEFVPDYNHYKKPPFLKTQHELRRIQRMFGKKGLRWSELQEMSQDTFLTFFKEQIETQLAYRIIGEISPGELLRLLSGE
jgi:hypothetical protein